MKNTRKFLKFPRTEYNVRLALALALELNQQDTEVRWEHSSQSAVFESKSTPAGSGECYSPRFEDPEVSVAMYDGCIAIEYNEAFDKLSNQLMVFGSAEQFQLLDRRKVSVLLVDYILELCLSSNSTFRVIPSDKKGSNSVYLIMKTNSGEELLKLRFSDHPIAKSDVDVDCFSQPELGEKILKAVIRKVRYESRSFVKRQIEELKSCDFQILSTFVKYEIPQTPTNQ